VVEGDGRERMRRSTGVPDAAYLDSADAGTERNRETRLEEAQLALSRLALDGIVMTDDTVWAEGRWTGKGALAVPMPLDRGWRVRKADQPAEEAGMDAGPTSTTWPRTPAASPMR
jgi:hypothetical protein